MKKTDDWRDGVVTLIMLYAIFALLDFVILRNSIVAHGLDPFVVWLATPLIVVATVILGWVSYFVIFIAFFSGGSGDEAMTWKIFVRRPPEKRWDLLITFPEGGVYEDKATLCRNTLRAACDLDEFLMAPDWADERWLRL
jgi:hypothetical protein